MEINNLGLTVLHNEEHFKYHSTVDGLIKDSTPEALLIKAEYIVYSSKLKKEKEALGLVSKSTLTDKLLEADLVRDNTLRGMGKVIEGGLQHFNQTVRDAAGRLNILWNKNGKITKKSYEDESGAIIKLIYDLKGSYAADVTTLGIGDWVTELEKDNNYFEALMIDRYNEQDSKTRLRMKDERIELDAAYHVIVKKINALIIVNGEAAFEAFVNKLNLRIEAYSNILAIRKGKRTGSPSAKAE